MVDDVGSPKPFGYYKDVPMEQLERLDAFRTRYPYASFQIEGLDWNYIDTQVGEQVVFILAGATTIG